MTLPPISYAKRGYSTGRPALPPDARLVSLTVRVPKTLRDALRARGRGKAAHIVRRALELYLAR